MEFPSKTKKKVNNGLEGIICFTIMYTFINYILTVTFKKLSSHWKTFYNFSFRCLLNETFFFEKAGIHSYGHITQDILTKIPLHLCNPARLGVLVISFNLLPKYKTESSLIPNLLNYHIYISHSLWLIITSTSDECSGITFICLRVFILDVTRIFNELLFCD